MFREIKEIIEHLNFAKKSFTKGGFRHVVNYISGLIVAVKKTVRKISKECLNEKHSSTLNRILTDTKIEKEKLEQKYLKKIKYIFKNYDVFLLIDDTLVERNGKHIEEAQKHYDHSKKTYINGHQFVTAMLYTPFLQLPLFPELYSRNTGSKIEMAKEIINKLKKEKVKIKTVLFDSWYSDQKLINLCIKADMQVICRIKANRSVRKFKKHRYQKLSFFTKKVNFEKNKYVKIKEKSYCIWTEIVHLKKLPSMRLVISHKFTDGQVEDQSAYFISSNLEYKPEEIIAIYQIRWNIETYHRDIKQNLGFDKAFFRKKEGIVRHAIFVSIAYAILNLSMYYNKDVKRTTGEFCEYLRNKWYRDAVEEIIRIENPDKRLQKFEEVFIN